MHHANLEQLYTLVGGFSGADGGWRATIPGTHWPSKVDRRDQTPRHCVGDVSIIEMTRDALVQAPQAIIPYLWVFEGPYEEENGFRPGTSCHQ